MLTRAEPVCSCWTTSLWETLTDSSWRHQEGCVQERVLSCSAHLLLLSEGKPAHLTCNFFNFVISAILRSSIYHKDTWQWTATVNVTGRRHTSRHTCPTAWESRLQDWIQRRQVTQSRPPASSLCAPCSCSRHPAFSPGWTALLHCSRRHASFLRLLCSPFYHKERNTLITSSEVLYLVLPTV